MFGTFLGAGRTLMTPFYSEINDLSKTAKYLHQPRIRCENFHSEFPTNLSSQCKIIFKPLKSALKQRNLSYQLQKLGPLQPSSPFPTAALRKMPCTILRGLTSSWMSFSIPSSVVNLPPRTAIPSSNSSSGISILHVSDCEMRDQIRL